MKVAEHVLTKHKVAIKILNRRKIRQMDMEEKGQPKSPRSGVVQGGHRCCGLATHLWCLPCPGKILNRCYARWRSKVRSALALLGLLLSAPARLLPVQPAQAAWHLVSFCCVGRCWSLVPGPNRPVAGVQLNVEDASCGPLVPTSGLAPGSPTRHLPTLIEGSIWKQVAAIPAAASCRALPRVFGLPISPMVTCQASHCLLLLC